MFALILALTERERITILEVGGSVIVAMTVLVGVIITIIWQGRRTRAHLDTGNGHTAGEAIHRIEDTQQEHAIKIDSIEVQVRETREDITEGRVALETHILENAPLIAWVRAQVEKGEE